MNDSEPTSQFSHSPSLPFCFWISLTKVYLFPETSVFFSLSVGTNKRTKKGRHDLDSYLSRKHDELLAGTLEPGTYKKTVSLVIIDAFSVEITEDQATLTDWNFTHSLYKCAVFCSFMFQTNALNVIRQQANVLRSAEGVRVVEKNQEVAWE